MAEVVSGRNIACECGAQVDAPGRSQAQGSSHGGSSQVPATLPAEASTRMWLPAPRHYPDSQPPSKQHPSLWLLIPWDAGWMEYCPPPTTCHTTTRVRPERPAALHPAPCWLPHLVKVVVCGDGCLERLVVLLLNGQVVDGLVHLHKVDLLHSGHRARQQACMSHASFGLQSMRLRQH